MADPIKIKIKRGLTAGVEPSGLTYGEIAINITDKKMFVGGVTGETILLFAGTTGGGNQELVTGGSQFTSGDPVAIIQSYSATFTVPLIQDGSLWFNTDTGILYTGFVSPSGDAQWVQSTTINNPNNQQ